MTRRAARAGFAGALLSVVASLLLGTAAPAEAKDLLDWVIEAVDPTLAPARPLIECLAGGGDAVGCAADAAKKQSAGALPIGPSDDRVKKAVAVFVAAREERWIDVLNVGGEVVAKTISCAMLPLGGPLKGPACNIIGWVIANNAGALDKAYRALTGPDWWALVDLLGPAACEMIPGDGAAGAAKEVLCGPLAGVILEAKKLAETVANGLVSGADAVENLVFGDDSHMPYDKYFALYWQPWYHYSTSRVFQGESLGMGDIYEDCVDYFDSHNQYRSTAKKTCSDLRNKFSKHVHAFAEALPVAVDGYFETVARPGIRAMVRASYGQPAAPEPPGQSLFVQNCTFQMRQRFPFPEPNDAACQLLDQYAKDLAVKKPKLGGSFFDFSSLYKGLAASCYEAVKRQTVEPTVWARACEAIRPAYAQAFAGEALKLIATIGRLKNAGCVGPGAAAAKTSGLVLTCDSPASYSACLTEFQNTKKFCRVEVPVVSASAGAGVQAGPAQPVGAAVQGAAGAAATRDAGSRQPAERPSMVRDPRTGPPVESPPPSQAATAAAAGALGRLQLAPLEIEAEALLGASRVQVRGGQAVAQPMTGFGSGWSGGAQLFWHGGAVGATLDLLVDVPRAGSWAVEVGLTRAPDYGIVEFEVNGNRVPERFDGYAPRVSGPVVVSLGTFALQAGPRRVSLMIVGRDRAATGWLVGVDRVRLKPVAAP